MTDIVDRIEGRINDAPLPTEYLLDEALAEIKRLRIIELAAIRCVEDGDTSKLMTALSLNQQ